MKFISRRRPAMARGQKLARSCRIPVLLAIVRWCPGQSAGDLAEQYEAVTGEITERQHLYGTLRIMREAGLLKRVPPGKQGVLRAGLDAVWGKDVLRINRQIRRYIITPRGDNLLSVWADIIDTAISKQSARHAG